MPDAPVLKSISHDALQRHRTEFASALITAGYLARGHPTVAVLSSLLCGFAPLIGLFVLLIILALLYSYL